ncbi:MAG: M16 family metallopeptidase [Opitutales bacterium]
MKTIIYSLFVLFTCGNLVLGRPTPAPSKQTVSATSRTARDLLRKSLKQDSQIKHGVLKNGIHYYFLPKKGERLSLRLMVNAGAAMEEPHHDGIAHFIEHMTFNGTTHFKPGTLIQYFQKNGMGFGNDTNAFTSYLHTVYQIDLPNNLEQNLREGLTVLYDQGFGCLFLPQEIDRERGVILSEMRTRDNAAYRSYKASAQFFCPETLLAKRFVIGLESTINAFQQNDFFEFYKRWYTTDRMRLIVTGDADFKSIKKLVNEVFGKASKSKKVLKDPDLGYLKKQAFSVGVHKDTELPNVTLLLRAQKTAKRDVKTLADLRKDCAWKLIETILHHRLESLKKKTNLQNAYCTYGSDLNVLEGCDLTFCCTKDHVFALVKELEKFSRRISTFGFSQSELEDAKQAFCGTLKTHAGTEANDTVKEAADRLVYQFMDLGFVLSSQQKLDYFNKIAFTITPDYCLSLWKDLWAENQIALFVSGPFDATFAEKDVLNVFKNSQKEVLKLEEAYQAHTFQSPFVKDRKVTIIDRYDHQNLGVECLRLSNNLRINLKKTDFEKNRILVHLAIGNGLVELKDSPYPGIQYLLSSSFISGGLKQCDQQTLNRIFDGKLISLDFDVDVNGYCFKALTDRENFRQQMELIGAYMVEPGYREEGLSEFRKCLPTWYEKFAKTPEGVFKDKVTPFLTLNDPRFTYPTQTVLLERTFEEARKLLAPVFAKHYMELTLVGDFDRNEVIDVLTDTLGRLDDRDAQKKELPEDCKKLAWPEAQTKDFSFDSVIDKAISVIVWPTESVWNQEHTRILTILKSILQNRLIFEIRQALGDTYSPRVDLVTNEVWENRGSMTSLIYVDPKKLDDIAERTLKIAEAIANDGVSQDELDRAIKPYINQLKQKMETNVFWLELIKNIQQYPQKDAWMKDIINHYEAIKTDDIQRLARLYLKRNRAICIHIQPKPLDNAQP